MKKSRKRKNGAVAKRNSLRQPRSMMERVRKRQESPGCGELCGHKSEHTHSGHTETMGVIQNCGKLSRSFSEQLLTGTFLLNLCVQLVHVVRESYKQNLRCDLLLASQQKLAKAVVLLYDTESTL